jgi:glycosyltransferase involved in cell wall biosynthesis
LTVGPIPPEWGGRLRGGVTRFNVTLLDEFRKHPWHRVEPLGVLIPPPQRVRRRLADQRSPLPIFMQPEGGRPRRFTRGLLERERPDAILLNNLAAFNGARFARVHREVAPEIPAIAVVHEWRAIRAKGGERGERYRVAAQAGLDSVAAVVFPSRHTRDLGPEELDLRYPERAVIIPNPLQPAFASERVDVTGPRRGVAFVGSYNPRKNPASLLRAAAAGNFEVVMQGRGPLEEELRELHRELDLGDRVTFAPFVKSRRPKRHVAAVIDVMRSAELVCLPSLSESFGLVMIEALAAGAPVAGFGPTLREIRDQLGIDVGEPLDDPTPENVGAAIEAIRSRRWDRERLRRAALSEYSAATVARRYASLVREVAR